MTARSILLAALLVAGLAGCDMPPPGRYSRAFDDCYNRPPLYQQEHGCYQGH